MKEIWKLIELLNEYEKWDVWSYDEEMWMPYYWWGDDCDYDTYLISKKYWFIKWLVENDKIDRDNQALQYAKSDLSKFFAEWKDKNWMSDDYAMLLMLLAIQDEPIRFLCEILK